MKELVIGTRKSDLAVAQTKLVANRLQAEFPDYKIILNKISTKGDRILDRSLVDIGGKGLFIKEIEVALLQEEIDLAVHSLKDVPGAVTDQFEIVASPKRANPYDVLISNEGQLLDQLAQGARIGTGSARRKSQLLNYRPDLEVVAIRGNINTRLDKLANQDLDAIVLAAAGLERMGWEDKITQYLDFPPFIPAVGQGALALEVRKDDQQIKRILSAINHQPTYDVITAERGFLACLDGDCKAPLGALAQIRGDKLTIAGMVAKLDGSRLIKDQVTGLRKDVAKLGAKLGEKLLNQGAKEILAEIKEEN
ncbi:porphobilinogen deaminase [Halobacteroides halobius DSM 5150]|uniref:Porphobilinogen deaminase n=1 Tax=Halobacteroides halobius (strain ATCC 35273 / DSM 5150 / MD-1) TaxID=748449 RepID=L0K7E1_HALHC|nr:hydroxymethylbilane synthase [Halobacteroides halobius]AGB41202.1 porphobilinogen deaminase [Halobacteroides halobius DSM 5150]